MNRHSSRPPFESNSAPPPEVFTDRSVGLDAVPSVFRDAGYVVHTIQEVFGNGPVPDVEWIQYAGERDMLAICKDDRIRYNYLEWDAIHRTGLRVLCLGDKRIGIAEMTSRFRAALVHLPGLVRAPGPWVFGVHAHGRVQRMTLNQMPRKLPE